MNRLPLSLLFLGALSSLTACSGEASLGDTPEGDAPDTQEQDVIIGRNDLLTVSASGDNVSARYRALLDGFGRLRISGGLCTATHVGNGVVVSAGHCFNAPSREVRDRACSGTVVEWGYRSGRSSVPTSQCTRILAMANGSTTDYAIFRVSPVPSVSVPIAAGRRPAQGARLTIFSHPQGRPLQWSGTCPLSGRVSSNEFGHTCDTQGGSSGATILEDSTLRVIGIHWGGGGSRNIGMFADASPLASLLASSGARFMTDEEAALAVDAEP
mgnify:CR=1 FL=1